jgi:protease-4
MDIYNSKRKKFAWLVFGVVLIIGLAFAGSIEKRQTEGFDFGGLVAPTHFEEKTVEGEGDEKIVLLRVEGVLYDIPVSEFGGDPGIVHIERLGRQFDQAKEDASVKGLILLVNSPGGTVTASQTIAEKMTDFKKSGKKILVLMREIAASGGYYISSQADKIVANESTLTGSIGVIFQTANLEDLYKKIGYQPITFKAGRLKDIGSTDRPITDEERAIIQKLLDEEHEIFKKVVAEGRKLDQGKVNKVADGRIFSGRQAKEIGLVDELGNLPKAIEIAKKEAGLESVRVVEYVSPFGFLGNFLPFDFFGSSKFDSLVDKISGQTGNLPGGLMYLWIP